MRSFDRAMPEELNRVLTDHASDLLFCSTETAVENLRNEAAVGAVHLVGDVMADVSLTFAPIAAERSRALADLALEPGGYLLVTAHRAGNVDVPDRLERLVALIERLPGAVVLPAPSAHGEAAGRDRPARPAGERRQADPAARLPRLPRADAERHRRPDRLRRGPEGGLPARDAVHHAARHDRVGGDRFRRLERARGPGCGRGAGGARSSAARRGATRSVRRRACRGACPRRTRLVHCARMRIGIIGLGYVGLPLGGRVPRGRARGGGHRRRSAARPEHRERGLRHRGHSLRAAGGCRLAPDRINPLRRPRRRRGGNHRRADAPLPEPRARPRPARLRRHVAGERAAAGPARGARVDHLPRARRASGWSRCSRSPAWRPAPTSTWPSRPSAWTPAGPTTRSATRRR